MAPTVEFIVISNQNYTGVKMAVEDVSDADFEDKVIRSKEPVVVDLWAAWCGPCRLYGPVIEEVSKGYEGKVKFVKLNVDENEKTARRFNVSSIPTTLLIKGGQLKAMNIGAIPKEALKKWISGNI